MKKGQNIDMYLPFHQDPMGVLMCMTFVSGWWVAVCSIQWVGLGGAVHIHFNNRVSYKKRAMKKGKIIYMYLPFNYLWL